MSKKIFVISAAILAATLAAPAMAAGAYVQSAGNTALAASANTLTTILSVQVPAGTWIVNAHAGAVNFGSEDYVRCWLYVNGTGHDGSATMNGYSALKPAVAHLSVADLVTTSGPQVFALKCSHDNNISGEYIDAGASMVISRAPKQ